jgi:hypothetical protein
MSCAVGRKTVPGTRLTLMRYATKKTILSADLIEIKQLSRSWLSKHTNLNPFIERITINYCVMEHLKENAESEFERLCGYITSALPNLKSSILYLHLTDDQLEHAIYFPKHSDGLRHGGSWVCRIPR